MSTAVMATICEIVLSFPSQLAAMTTPFPNITRRIAVRRTSLMMMARAIHHSTPLPMSSTRTIEMRSLSAMGSSILPTSVT